MPGLVPGIHVLGCVEEDVDGRDKPGHDDGTRHYWAHFNWPMEPAIARANKSGPSENSFIIFVDGIFTTLIEPLFTNIFDPVAPIAAIACLYRSGNAG